MLAESLPKILSLLFLTSLILPAASYSQQIPMAAARITGYWYFAEAENPDQSDLTLFHFDTAEGTLSMGRLKAETGEFEALDTKKISVAKDLPNKIEMISDDDGSTSTCAFQDDDLITCRDSLSPNRETRLKRFNLLP